LVSGKVRHGRILELTSKAATGNFNWDQLMQIALSKGVTTQTAKSYLDEVYKRLKKRGLLK
jgi:hypothetical protein